MWGYYVKSKTMKFLESFESKEKNLLFSPKQDFIENFKYGNSYFLIKINVCIMNYKYIL